MDFTPRETKEVRHLLDLIYDNTLKFCEHPDYRYKIEVQEFSAELVADIDLISSYQDLEDYSPNVLLLLTDTIKTGVETNAFGNGERHLVMLSILSKLFFELTSRE